ncbi:MAG: CehA/McbA family metallohydrolase [Myxococcales bacterium]|nr:CehA/McbA family metallohydrolase [Myxococcales bacterium]MCB9630072.1 CehA/McbA family metallohydrolase [Sandaracinaceae bacterium]
MFSSPDLLLRARPWAVCSLLCALAAPGCGGDGGNADAGPTDQALDDQGLDAGGPTPVPPGPWYDEGDDGVANPLAATATQALAGRATAGMLPDFHSGLQSWATGDFILANDKVAMVIEDVGPSDNYDPWGGRPVGIARVVDGELFEPGDFGEFFVFLGRMSVVTEFVGVINDGSNGEAAVVRAQGRPAGTPFLERLLGRVLSRDFSRIPTAIDYQLEPGAEHVDVYLTHTNYDDFSSAGGTLHGFMYGPRMPVFTVGVGFNAETATPMLAFDDDIATSWAYRIPDQDMGFLIAPSGFTGMSAAGYTIEGGGQTRRHYARIYIGGRGIDGVLDVAARTEGIVQRAITGTVYEADGTTPAAGVRIHVEQVPATGAPVYLTRTLTAADGTYTVHVPFDANVQLRTFRRGDAVVGPLMVNTPTTTQDFTLPATGRIHVVATDPTLPPGSDRLPVRVQVLPLNTSVVPSVPSRFGEPSIVNGRLHVEYATGHGASNALGEVTLTVPPGDWNVVVSRGTEYEIYSEELTVTAGATNEVAATLSRSVDTTGVMCADYHVHTHRSNDSGDNAYIKLRSAIADGLDIPARSEHEFAVLTDPLITEMGLGAWAYGLSSLELTTFEYYGHFGVIPLTPTSGVNGGTEPWQTYPSATDPSAPITFLTPPQLFDNARARPEAPAVIINHPRGGANYFDYVGLDAQTGQVDDLAAWDTEFQMIEVFNGSGWTRNRDGVVRDWFALLNVGRPMFAVGSSDSHSISGSPVGYPRTCLTLGTDNPRALNDAMIRDASNAGHSFVTGGMYVDAHVGSASHGDTVTGVGATADVDVRVQGASWIVGDFVMDVIVDGVVVETIDIDDLAPTDPGFSVTRYMDTVSVTVAPGGSWVVFAVYSIANGTLTPVHPGEQAFGVTNPIFLER